MMTGPVIEAENVVKTLGSGVAAVQALRGVSLALAAGELALLMGPSGSGKTTLLSILGCMLRPSTGTVRVCGQATEGLGPEELARLRRRNIGFVFQNYHLFPTLTAAENVRIALDVRGVRARIAKEKTRAALAEVGLSNKAASLPRALSGGEQQRVAIARAIAGDPAVVLADEPTAALDGENGQAVMTILARLADNFERGVLVVTHDTRLLPFADRIIHIEDGRIGAEERKSAGAAPEPPAALRQSGAAAHFP